MDCCIKYKGRQSTHQEVTIGSAMEEWKSWRQSPRKTGRRSSTISLTSMPRFAWEQTIGRGVCKTLCKNGENGVRRNGLLQKIQRAHSHNTQRKSGGTSSLSCHYRSRALKHTLTHSHTHTLTHSHTHTLTYSHTHTHTHTQTHEKQVSKSSVSSRAGSRSSDEELEVSSDDLADVDIEHDPPGVAARPQVSAARAVQ